jgi:pimeloyl-ACP methyl ester carboxylesterase
MRSRELQLLHGSYDESDGLLESVGAQLGRPHFAYDRAGRGRTPDTREQFRLATFADHAAAVIERLGGPRPVIGYSEGGMVAQYLALRRPELVTSLVLIATIFDIAGLVPPAMEPGNSFWGWASSRHAERSPDGSDHFPAVVARVQEMFLAGNPDLTPRDLGRLEMPILVIGGDRDALVPRDITLKLFDALPNAQLAIIPGGTHGMPFEKPSLVAQLIRDFLDERHSPRPVG